MAQAAAIECYFDFTRYGSVAPGATIVSNVYGNVPAVLKPRGTTLDRWGVTIDTEQSAGNTGVLIPATALAAYTGDFTIQVWFIASVDAMSDSMIYGGTTSGRVDDSLVGDQALFVGYNNMGTVAQFLRPVIGDGSRWGVNMVPPVGTGMAVLSPQDYVLTYNSTSHVVTAYLNGINVGAVNATGFQGLAALSKGFAIGGVQNSAFKGDTSAPVNIRSFMIYSGALDPSQIAKIHAEGASVTLDGLKAAEVVVK